MLPDDQMMVKIPNDSDGRLLRINNNGGTRFILGNPAQCWSCVAIDSITDVRTTAEEIPNDLNGIINIKLSNKTAPINKAMDNLSLGLAKQNCY
jgi:hypothetical protein